MMTGTMAALMWLMMGLMLLAFTTRGITWARRRLARSASPSQEPQPRP